MDLSENPFCLLGAMAGDDSAKITALIEDKTRSLNYKTLTQIQANLTNPQRRLAAEVAWLPGLQPEEVAGALLAFKTAPISLLALNLPPLARCNALASALPKAEDRLLEFILELVKAYDEINLTDLAKDLNAARGQGGWPLVLPKHLEVAVSDRKAYFLESIYAELEKLTPPKRLILLTTAISQDAALGQKPASSLLAETLGQFAKEVRLPLAHRTQTVLDDVFYLHSLIDSPPEGLTSQGPESLEGAAAKLVKSTKSWDQLAQPFQLLAKSLKKPHPESQVLALKIRELAFLAYNSGGYLTVALVLTDLLSEVFAEVVDVASQAQKDAAFLDELAKKRHEEDTKRLKADFLERLLATILNKTRDLETSLAAHPSHGLTNLDPQIEELRVLLNDVASEAKERETTQKVALTVRNLALRCHHRYGRADLALVLLTALAKIFDGQEPFASLFASDLKSLGQTDSEKPPDLSLARRPSLKLGLLALVAVILLILILAFFAL
ncbi:MAG: hypothetical protein LBI10_02715 [Deltaproteobacteria bacterium]|jgi:hypothetical protein|nr:hypothetical protein [Deltaproteobacteria bacterium]